MHRKRFQRGSVKPRKRLGRMYWYAQWREGGSARSKELGLCSEMSRAQAESLLADIVRPINEATGKTKMPNVNHTFGQFVQRVYLPVYRGKWKNSTAMTEVDRIQYHLVGELGSCAIAEITREQLQDMLNAKGNKVGRSVIDHLRFRLRSIFRLALAEGVVERSPAEVLYTPRHCKAAKKKRALTREDFRHVMDTLELREKVIVRLATIEGMRPGEILGLQVGDLELRANRLEVRRRLYKGDIDSPKNDRSIRDVALSDGSALLVGAWVETLVQSSPRGWLFPSETLRTPASKDNVWSRWILPKLRPAGLAWANFQAMRRTFASRGKEFGLDAHTRAAQMGNTVDVNENEYALCDFETRLAAVRRFEATFFG